MWLIHLTMKSSSLVVKANRLIQASYKLDLVEQRVMEMAIAWSRTHVEDLNTDTWIELSVKDYVDLYESDEKSAYRQLQSAAKSLRQRTLLIEGIDDATGNPATIETGWVSYIMYVPKSGLIRIRFSEIIVPCISRLERQFTSFRISSIVGLSSAYAIRLYELLKQYEKVGKRYFDLLELREFVEANEAAYDRIDNLKSRVIDKAITQINQYSDLDVDYSTEKSGRSVTGLTFLIAAKQPAPKSRKTSVHDHQPKKPVKEVPILLSKHQQAIEDAVLNSMLKRNGA